MSDNYPHRLKVPSFAVDYPNRARTIAELSLTFYCCNCYRKAECTYLTGNFGPFCDDCLKEIEPLLKEPINKGAAK